MSFIGISSIYSQDLNNRQTITFANSVYQSVNIGKFIPSLINQNGKTNCNILITNKTTDTIRVSFSTANNSKDTINYYEIPPASQWNFPNINSQTMYIMSEAGSGTATILINWGGLNPFRPINSTSSGIDTTSLFFLQFSKLNSSNIYTAVNSFRDSLISRGNLRQYRKVSGNNSLVYNDQWVDSLVGSGGTNRLSSYLNSTAAVWGYYSNLTGTSGTDGFIIQFNSGLQFDWKEGTDWTLLSNASEIVKFNSNREALFRGATDQGAYDIQMSGGSSILFGNGGLWYLHAGSSTREFLNLDMGSNGRSMSFILPHDNSGEAGFYFYNNANANIIKFQADKSAITESDFIFYFGPSSTDGTWRLKRDGNNFVFERRESGSYVLKSNITP